MSTRCVVVGAGISGLSLAHALEKRGIEPLVVESEPRPGGKIRTSIHDGFLCEWGPASALARDPAFTALLDAAALSPRMQWASEAAKRRMVVVNGRPELVPTHPLRFASSPILSPRGKWRALADLVLPRGPSARGEDESIAGFARRRFGTAAATRIFYPLVSGLYAGDADALSLSSSFPWLAELEREHRSILLGAARSLGSSARPRLFSFHHGLQEMTDTLAATLGARLTTSTTVVELRHRNGFELVLSRNGDQSELSAPLVALAVPAYEAATIAKRLAPRAAAAAAEIPYAPVTLVYCGYRNEDLPTPLASHGFLVPRDCNLNPQPGLLGAVYCSAVFSGRSPDGFSLVSARLGGMGNAKIAALPDADLRVLVADEFTRLLGATAAPSFTKIIRHTRALPQYTLGHRQRVAVMDATEAAIPGLFFTGNAFRGLGIPDCVRNADVVANRIAAFAAQA